MELDLVATKKKCTKCGLLKTGSEFYKGHKEGTLSACCKECKRAYFKSKSYKAAKERYESSERARLLKRKRNKSRLVRRRANKAVQTRVANGLMPSARALKCDICGEQAAHYHHYAGYSRENYYKVQPLCVDCHAIQHRD